MSLLCVGGRAGQPYAGTLAHTAPFGAAEVTVGRDRPAFPTQDGLAFATRGTGDPPFLNEWP